MTDSSIRPLEAWASGDAYERYVGRWSRAAAREFIPWLQIPDASRWLDVGCGTGALTQAILQHTTPRAITAIDRSSGFVRHAARAAGNPRVRFVVCDAQRLCVASRGCDVAVSGLVLNFLPQPAQAVAEMSRAVAAGGTVALYVWDYAGKMEFMRHFWDAVAWVDPASAALDEGLRFPLCRPEPLAQLLKDNRLQAIEVRAIDVPTRFKDFDDFWLPFLGGQGPAGAYVTSLAEDRRSTLREELRRRLPIAADGSIDLVARAWAVRGVRAG